jgi:ABC-type amino acid transport system permease subunit
MLKVVLPQAIRNILPALGNEFVTIIKETSLASTFFVGELMTTYAIIKGVTFNVIPTLMDIGIIYFIMTFTLSKLMGLAEKKMKAGA